MKKLSVILLVLLVSLFLIVSCGEDNGNDTDANQTNSQTNTPDQTGDATQVGGETETGAPETKPVIPSDKVESFKIDGVNISEFKIFALDSIDEGYVLADHIENKYLGIKLPIEKDITFPGGENYIILDRQSYAYQDWSMTVENGNLYIKGSYRSFPKALELFTSYLDGSRGADVNITSANNTEGKIDKATPLYSTKEDLLAIYEYAMDSNYTLYGEHWGGGFGMISEFATAFYSGLEGSNGVGDCPAILDTDMIGFYLGNFPRSAISQIICECIEFAAKGGIITTHCHWQNPNDETRNTTYRGSIGSKELWTSVLTEGTEFNTKWKKQLDFNAEVYQAFKDAGLPVTFRPMIEANTGNFWWSYYHEDCMLTGDDLRDMWNYIYDYYVNELGFDHILWTYSPNAVKGADPASIDMYYPGDDKCDLVGMDWYIDSTMSRNIGNNYGYQTLLAHGKPTGLCEWGVFGNLSSPDKGQFSDKFSCRELVEIINTARSAGHNITFLETYMGSFGSATRMPDPEVLNNSYGIILLDDMPDIIRNAVG